MEQYTATKSIKQWAEDDRPREKLLHKGKAALSNAELLAILIRTGTRRKTAIDLAKELLDKSQNNLIELSKLNVQELIQTDGIGEAKALTMLAALELGNRRRAAQALDKAKICSSKEVFDIFHAELAGAHYEQFWLLLLNRGNKIIRKINISEGGVSGTIADPKKIFKMALDHNASSIILCHNHPSGTLKPSDSDIKLTRKLAEAGNMLDISVLDHVIIAEEKYYSFADEGKI
ncbi:MAG: DNA repair protein RadC [Bacteroidota bacterium]|nr:DNA repair protein RadC [Bacteroidota bacterium]